MIVKKDFINRLKDFGLNSYESKLWVALLSRGVSTAGELSDISNVPRSRAYDVLESLEKKGFIIVKVGKPIKYIAVSPVEVVDRVKKKVLIEAEQQHTLLEELKTSAVLDELNALHGTGVELIDPTDRSGAFRGRDKAYDHLATMIKKAKKSIVLMTTPQGVQRKAEILGNHLRRANKRGVKVRVALPAKGKQTLVHEIADVQYDKQHTARFCVVDGKELLVFLTDDHKVHEGYDCAIWIEAPHFVNYFAELFDTQWK